MLELEDARARLVKPEADKLPATPTSTHDAQCLAPLLYYAVAAGTKTLVHRLLDLGADPNPAPCGAGTVERRFLQVPVLALAVARRDHSMVHLLLSRGAAPLAVPSHLYLTPMREQGLHALPEVTEAAAAAAWCRAEDTELLAKALDIDEGPGFTMCYWLARAAKLPELTSTCAGGQRLSVGARDVGFIGAGAQRLAPCRRVVFACGARSCLSTSGPHLAYLVSATSP